MANTTDFLPNEYTVFEADQVLTDRHLRQLFNYLDQQDRWTRNKLIGIGIVCGLNIVQHTGVIEVTEGCAVSSQGYLIIMEEAMQYTYYLRYTGVPEPDDLTFTYPGNTNTLLLSPPPASPPNSILPLPFFKPYCNSRNIYLLLTDDEYNNLEEDAKNNAQTISSATAGKMLNDYVVVLFLEMNEKDLKNCDVFDCNNKGKQMYLTVRPLLVNKTDLPILQEIQPDITSKESISKTRFSGASTARTANILASKSSAGTFVKAASIKPNLLSGVVGKRLVRTLNTFTLTAPEVDFKRFNVPYTDLKTTDDVINAFLKLVDDATLSAVADAYNYCFEQYKSLLEVTTNPFISLLNDLKTQRDQIVKNFPIFIQYFYDFVDDLIKAYYEFRVKVSTLLSACCPDENLFPLHVVLGEATATTKDFIKDVYRTYFIYSPLFAKQENEMSESVFLFRRMQIVASKFTVLTPAQLRNVAIKILPSVYEQALLSQRAIPYYYTINETGNELYKYWSYYKTIRGRAASNLSYNANLYSSNSAVLEPLLYDIECYNFFRIEGHIGVNYQSALSNILQQRQTYNLPFDVVAIAADQLPDGTGTLPQCNIQDLETNYKLIVSEFSCKVHTPFCFITKLPFPPPSNVTGPILTAGTGLNAGATGAATRQGAAVTSLSSTVLPFSVFKLQEAAAINLTSFINVFAAYKKGDFMRKYCTPNANTIGSVYLNSLSSTGVFTNPVKLNTQDPSLIHYFYFFEYVDAVESLMQILIPATLTTIDMQAFGAAYKRFSDSLAAITFSVTQFMNEKLGNSDSPALQFFKDIEMNIFVDEFSTPVYACIDERLQTLQDEYKNRLQLYELQRSFYYYYKKHYGLEHKAGVPKGGTFVLVYHPAARQDPATNAGTVGARATTGLSAVTNLSQAHLVRGASPAITGAKLFMARKPKITPEKTTPENAKAIPPAENTSKPTAAATKPIAAQPGRATGQSTNTNLSQSIKNAITGQPVKTSATGLNQPGSLDIDTMSAIKNFANSATDISLENRTAILDFLTRAQTQLTPSKYAVAEDVVIADFYVPYLCCSDCPPIAYIIPPPAETVEFDIEPKEFLFDDAHNYPFTTEPPVTDEGKEQVPFSSPAVLNPGNLNLLTDANNVLYLHPAMPDMDKTFKATITYKSIPVEITIIRPDATFTITETQSPAGETLLQLEPLNKDGDKYEWTVNEIGGIFQDIVNPPAVSLSEIQQKTQSTSLDIALTISYTRNEAISEDTKTQKYHSEVCVDFELPIKIDTQFGSSANQEPGAEAFTTKDKIVVRVWDFRFNTEGGTFGFARVVPAFGGFGSGQCLLVNNINIEFDYSKLNFTPSQVTIQYLDQGGSENFSVNDSDVFAGEITQLPADIKGVSVAVTTNEGPNGRGGTVTLKGDIKTFRIGGQEFFIDNVCAE